jgi:uncharacterized protein YegP (UPF0339 family)
MLAAKFEIRQPKAGEYRWVLVSQGRTLATSAAYSRKALAQKSIDSFRMAAIAAPVDDQTPGRGKTPVAKVARVAGRAAGTAVAKGIRAVEKVEKAVAKPAKRAARTVKTATDKPAAPRTPARKS